MIPSIAPRFAIPAVVLLAAIAAAVLFLPGPGSEPAGKATFAGGRNCVRCHTEEFRRWTGSDHDLAMDVATDSTVLGDFNDALFPFEGKTHKFFRRDGGFFVVTEGPDGGMREYRVTHTFGVRPLQQYLVPFGDGKYQCLPIAWDTERNRWFNMAAMVYDRESRSPGNWLYWTNQAQNWNGMCAECHSTNLQKNFDPVRKSYATTWSDIDVNCEACHGPGSRHIEWAEGSDTAASVADDRGLVVKTRNITSAQLVDRCAPCHSRRSSLGPFDHAQNEFLGNAVPQLPVTPAYFADGQIRDEDYEYGSFTQSEMSRHDVRCTDCHDAHSLKLRFEGNALCSRCHKPERYDTPDHHFHRPEGKGSLCVSCHMDGRYYMGIDYRRDHSFRVPRPDLSETIGTPNACNSCHTERKARWSAETVEKWYGKKRKPHYGTAFADAATLKPGADSALAAIISGSGAYPGMPDMIKATAIEYLAPYQNAVASAAIRKSLNDSASVVRHSALRHFTAADSGDLLATVIPALRDPVRAVRLEAANKLSGVRREWFSDSQFVSLDSAKREYEAAMMYVADFPTGRFNLGRYYESTGEVQKAVEHYAEAIAIDNLFYPAKVNLAFLAYEQGDLDRAGALFRDVAEHHPEYPEADYNLGLLYAEQGRIEEAIGSLEAAIAKRPTPAVSCNLALLYGRTGRMDAAESTLLAARARDPGDYRILYALSDHYLKTGDRSEAGKIIGEMRSRFPDDEDVRKLAAALEGVGR